MKVIETSKPSRRGGEHLHSDREAGHQVEELIAIMVEIDYPSVSMTTAC